MPDLPAFLKENEICFKDKNGKVRLRIGLCDDDGSPEIGFYNEREVLACRLAIDNNDPSITLCDLHGKTRAFVKIVGTKTSALIRGGLDTGGVVIDLSEDGIEYNTVDQYGDKHCFISEKS